MSSDDDNDIYYADEDDAKFNRLVSRRKCQYGKCDQRNKAAGRCDECHIYVCKSHFDNMATNEGMTCPEHRCCCSKCGICVPEKDFRFSQYFCDGTGKCEKCTRKDDEFAARYHGKRNFFGIDMHDEMGEDHDKRMDYLIAQFKQHGPPNDDKEKKYNAERAERREFNHSVKGRQAAARRARRKPRQEPYEID